MILYGIISVLVGCAICIIICLIVVLRENKIMKEKKECSKEININ